MNDGKHECPGKCGRRVINRLFACLSCWQRLPAQYQRAIVASHSKRTAGDPGGWREHVLAMGLASKWLRENPR